MDDMDLLLARRIVWDALRTAVSHTDLLEDEHVSLFDIGLSTPEHREYFRTLVVGKIHAAGYTIDPANIPTGADDTPRRIMMELPGQSTKGNKP
jgi:hypothetical protein